MALPVVSGAFHAEAGNVATDETGYLFVYFTGNDKPDEAIRYAVADNELQFHALNNNAPVLSSGRVSETGGLRDPHILRGDDGRFYMTATDMVSANGWDSNRGLVLFRSDDLIEWTSQAINIQKRFSGNDDLKRVWAPQTIYDRKSGKYMVYWSMKHGDEPDIIYYAYTNPEFTDFVTEPKVLFTPEDGKSCIDADIVFKNGRYYMFYKTEGHGNGIKVATTKSLTSGKWKEQDGYKQQTDRPVEGSGVFKLNGSDRYVLMYDVYMDGEYQFCESSDLNRFTRMDDGCVTMDFHPRHGTVLPVTSKELSRLEQKWGRRALAAKSVADNGGAWIDTDGNRINCHGGNIIKVDSLYYWYGEHRPGFDSTYQKGVACYSSPDLATWTNEGIALELPADGDGLLVRGCTVERPKVVFCKATGKYVMWFHHELKGQGYAAAHAAVAVSDTPAGPFRFVRSSRVNPGVYPANFTDEQKTKQWNPDAMEWWTDEWKQAVTDGMLVQRDLDGGQMSRDMTVFVDTDGKAYHIYSSEENLTLHIAELSDDYMSHTGKYIRIYPTGHNEAPVVFKRGDKYWMITSGCTGWDPNQARMFSADSLMGEWTEYPSPCIGDNWEKTFNGQGAFHINVDGEDYFVADEWHPKQLADSRTKIMHVLFDNAGKPVIPYLSVNPLTDKR